MSTDPSHGWRRKLKLVLEIIVTVTGLLAVIPPVIGLISPKAKVLAEQRTEAARQLADDRAAPTIANTYVNYWLAGAITAVGQNTVTEVAGAPATPAPVAPPAPVALPAERYASAEPGTVGRLVTETSLLNNASWSPEVSRVNRLLTFDLRVEAVGEEGSDGHTDVTLMREGHDVCTVAINARTSAHRHEVWHGQARCVDTLPAGAAVLYRAKTAVVNMAPLTIKLQSVYAVKK